MEIDKIPQWILALEQEDVTFLKNFVLKSGSLKEIAKLYGVSYPTVRLRLDKLIQKIELSDQKEDEPFSTFIKGLAVDSRIDLEPLKLLLKNINRKGRTDYVVEIFRNDCHYTYYIRCTEIFEYKEGMAVRCCCSSAFDCDLDNPVLFYAGITNRKIHCCECISSCFRTSYLDRRAASVSQRGTYENESKRY